MFSSASESCEPAYRTPAHGTRSKRVMVRSGQRTEDGRIHVDARKSNDLALFFVTLSISHRCII